MRISLFLNSLAGGGAERAVLHLARAFCDARQEVTVVVSQRRGEFADETPAGCRLVELGAAGKLATLAALVRLPLSTQRAVLPAMFRQRYKKVRALPRLVRHLETDRPDVLLASTNMPNVVACWAARLAEVRPLLVLKQDVSLSAPGALPDDPLQRSLPRLIREWYPRADAVVAVSSGLADELVGHLGVPRGRIRVLYNPVDLERVSRASREPLDDPWFAPGAPPVVVAVGRLHRQKDYPTLLRALVVARQHRELRLAVLGEGGEREALEALARELGLAECVRFAGFQANPFAFMARSAVFAMSSRWEGLSLVLIEALACGCRVVSTDCPTGPAEVLEQGRHGTLVPVGNAEALAAALLTALGGPADPQASRRRARDFDAGAVGWRYLELFRALRPPPSSHPDRPRPEGSPAREGNAGGGAPARPPL